MSQAPRTLFRASSGNSPEPSLPRCPVTAAKVARAAPSRWEGGALPADRGNQECRPRGARDPIRSLSSDGSYLDGPQVPPQGVIPLTTAPYRCLVLQPESQDRGKQTIDHFTFISRNRGQGEGSQRDICVAV